MQKKNCGNSNISPRVVSHYGLAIYIEKYLNAKEELWKLKYFTKGCVTLWPCHLHWKVC
jgi:hypothetical protein